MKQFTHENIQAMLHKTKEGSLKENVLNYILDSWGDYTEKENIILDVLKHGCISGLVSDLFYYSDTTAYYEKHKQEINDLLAEALESYGCDIKALFAEQYDEQDPLFIDPYNQHLLAWFGFEQTMQVIATEFNLD